jgi:very-short-patch-repair endonuclease
MHPQVAILRIASEQGGAIRRDQALKVGFTVASIDWRVRTDEWQPLAKGVYRLMEMPGRISVLRAAATVLPHATVSHYSAAVFHGLNGVSNDTISVTVPSKTTHIFPGVRVFRNDDLSTEHLSVVRGLRATTLERTIIDLAAVLSPRHLEFIVDDLLASGRCRVADLRFVLDSIARRGKPGVATMRALLDDRSVVDENRTQLERAGHKLLEEGGFQGYESEYPMPWAPNLRFDVAFPADQMAIEWDSIRWHTQKRRFQTDRARDRMAVEHGWRVLRFTWRDIHDDPNGVIETIRIVLATGQPVESPALP